MREKYLTECATVEQNCTYTAETHHIIAVRQKTLSAWFQIVPSVVSAVLGVLVGGGIVPFWFVWLSVISAVIAAVGNVLNPLKEYYDHLNAAKNFTCLKQDARSLSAAFSSSMSDSDLAIAAKALHDRYNDLVKFAPPTNNDSFEKARKRVQDGIHALD